MGPSNYLLSNTQQLEVLSLTKTATAIHVTEDAIIQMANDAMLNIWDKDRSVIGKTLEEALPELKGQPFIGLFKKVWNEGITISGSDTPAILNVDGKLQTFYFDFEYRAIKNETGNTYAILHTATDVTERYLSKQRELKLTDELRAINEELSASNEELRASNEELIQSRENLALLNLELDERVEQRTRALMESEALFRNIFEQSPLALAVLSGRELIIESANQLVLNIWGKKPDVVGRPLAVALPEIRGQHFLDILDEVFTSGNPYFAYASKAIMEHNGELAELYVDFVYSALTNHSGVITGIIISAIDVTQREISSQRATQLTEEVMSANEELSAINEELSLSQKNLLQLNDELEERVASRTKALTASEARFRMLIQQAPVGIAVFDSRELIIEAANDVVLGFWGKTPNIVAIPLGTALPELQGQPFLQLLDNVFIEGATYYGNEAKSLNERNGELITGYFNFIYQPIKDDAGNVRSIMMVATEVTEQVLARLELQRAQDILRMAIEAAGIGTWTVELETDKLIISDRTRDIHGIPPDKELTLTQSSQMIEPKHRERIMNAIEVALQTKSNFYQEYTITQMDSDKVRWLRSSGKGYYDEQGKPVYITGTILDITEQVQDDMRKNDFIGMASHELKTPLTSLSAIIQILNLKAKDSQESFTAGALEKANQQVKKMTAMINGFLNVSRLESGKILVLKDYFKLDELIHDVIEETTLTVSSHTLACQNCDAVTIYADREKIGSVISNLLSNAVKYSARGKTIEITCDVVGDEARVSVKDEGIGIRQQEIEKLFDRYYRVENSNTRHISGFGIGLYLSAEIIRRHDGRIWAESELGNGSTFYFTLPLNGN